MKRTIKHVEIHRIGTTELRVVSDVDMGETAVVQVEEAVIRDYMRVGHWPHRQVSLFVLNDLQPLIRQMASHALPLGGVAALDTRTVINLYDLANPRICHVFVNQQMMLKEGYWDDMLAIRGLLAHEHAHPLAENASTRASRGLTVDLTLAEKPTEQHVRLEGLLSQLVEQLCLTSPREIFTNLMAITSGFGHAMLHLNRRNVANTSKSLAGRLKLHEILLQDVAKGTRSTNDINQLLFAGDMESYCNLAMELAPFDRTGDSTAANELAGVLEQELFPYLDPQFAPTFAAIRQLYTELPTDLSPTDLRGWSQQVADIIVGAMHNQGLTLHCAVREL